MSATARSRLSNIETGRHIDMRKFDFTLAFSVMAADPLDARLKLKELLMSISKEEILWAMSIVKGEDDA